MKKFLLGLSTVFSVFIASASFAVTESDNGYFASASGGKMSAKAFVVPATNITVLNYSDESIHVTIPEASSFHYEIPSGSSRTISRNAYYGYTHIQLQYWNHITFFDQFVCRRAIATVDGRPGAYRITVDGKYC